MSDPITSPASLRLQAAVAEYLEAVERGERPDRAGFAARYADVASELGEFFENHDQFAQLARPDAQPLPLATPPAVSGQEVTVTLDRSGSAAAPGISVEIPASQYRPGAGYRIGDYEVLEELGRGGMGVVYKARHVRLGRVVALKMVLAGQFAAAEDLERFQAEAQAAAGLEHNGIVPIYEASQWQGQPFFTMAFIDGPSLASRLDDGPLHPHAAARLLLKIAAAVAFAHRHGIIHRDLKPANILLARSEAAGVSDAVEHCEPKITDFGLAKRAETESHLTVSGQVLGTPSYMPPEQAAGRQREIGPAADVYALGAILYAMLTGRAPFQSENPVEVLLQVLESEPQLPCRLRPEVPRELEWICMKCLEKQPASRYASAAELAADLDRFLRHEPPEARSPTLGQKLRRWMRIRPVLAWHVIGIGVLLALVQLIYALRPHSDIPYHLLVSGVLATWLLGSFGLQWLIDAREDRGWAYYLWNVADPLFLTALLSLIVSPLGPLLGGYLLLVCASGLFFQTRHVLVTTLSVLASYALLLVLRPEESRPWHYSLCFAATLAITGFVVGYQVWRMGVLREYYDERRPR
jgi:serine/threonine protein kinase